MNDFFRKTERGAIFTDQMDFQVVGYTEESYRRLKDDYPGAFKPPASGQPHPSGLGTIPTSGSSLTQNSTQGKGLIIKVAATHAGLITRNNTFYLPDKMRRGASTWTEHYNKPIQLHHNDNADPVGRVIAARYVETVGAVQDRFKNHVLKDSKYRTADSKFWRDFVADGPFIEKLRMIKLLDAILDDPHYQGVGYIELTADITDPEAIQKILDGRFLTGSVGAVSDKAVCSICNTDWLEEDHCGHRPGRTYDGKKCFVIAGNLEYDEWSFVNTPADRHAAILAVESGMRDSAIEDSASRVLHFVPVSFGVIDNVNKEGSAMKDELKADENQEVKTSEELKDSASATEGVQKKVKVEDAIDSSAESTGNTVEIKDDASSVDLLMEKLFADEAKIFTAEDSLALYKLMMANYQDAAMSDDKLKKLPRSAFCGPKRTFPVVDAIHYKAAKELLNSYSGSADKSALLAAVERKAKALGFTKDSVQKKPEAKVEDAVAEEATEPKIQISVTVQKGTEFTDEEKFNNAKRLLNYLSQILGRDTIAKAAIELELAVDPEAEQALVDEVTKHEETIVELRDQLSALRREFSATVQDMAELEDRIVELTDNLHSEKAARLHDMLVLSGRTAGPELLKECLSLSDSALDSELKAHLAKFDISKIADKFNNGLSRTPDEIVDNPIPAAVSEPSTADNSTKKVEDSSIKPTYATQNMVDQAYHHLFVTQQNPLKAKMYYTEMVAKGLARPDPSKMINSVENKEE